MGSLDADIMNSYQQLITLIKNFRGPDAYILDTITKVSTMKTKLSTTMKIEKVKDVTNLLSMISLNRL